jgi:hypothetical protein
MTEWQALMLPDHWSPRRPAVRPDRGTTGLRMWGGRDRPETNDEPVIGRPRFLGQLIGRGLSARGRSRATIKRWVRPDLLRINHGNTFTDDPESFNPTAVPVWRKAATAPTYGWPAKAPISIYVQYDEGGPRLKGLPSTIDYSALVASDLRGIAVSNLSLGFGVERRPVAEHEMYWAVIDGVVDDEARRRC